MKIEIKMYNDEDDETTVMKKVSPLIKQAKEAGFKICDIEFKDSNIKSMKINTIIIIIMRIIKIV